MAMFGVPLPSVQQTPILTPDLIKTLLDMGIDPYEWAQGQVSAPPLMSPDLPSYGLPETTVYGDTPPLTVGDTLTQRTDPMFPVEQQTNPMPDVAPEVGVNPPPGQERGLMGSLLGGLGSMFGDPGREALMAAGLGILGAQNTYGSALGALGQGGLAGMQTYSRAKRREDIDKFRRDQLASVEKRSAAETKLAQSKLASEEEGRKQSRLQVRFKAIRELADTNPEAATAMIAADPELQEYLKIPAIAFKGKPPSIGQLKAAIFQRLSPEEQKAVVLSSGGGGRSATKSDLALAALRGDPEAARGYAAVSGLSGFVESLSRRAIGLDVIDPAVQAMSPEAAKSKLASLGKLDAIKSLIGASLTGGDDEAPLLGGGVETAAPPTASAPVGGGEGVTIRDKKSGKAVVVKSLPGGQVPEGYELVP